MNALAIREDDEMQQWKAIKDQATILIKSGFLPQSIKTPEQALAIILTGREIGIGTMAALNNINVIAGKPTVSPQLMLALIYRTKELEDLSITDDGQACTVTMKRRGLKPHTETFSMKDAAMMKTTEYIGGEKKTISLADKYNWKQMPAVMRKWRAVAACARVIFSDVTNGLYFPEEMGASVNEDGEVIDIQPEPTAEPEVIEADEAEPMTIASQADAVAELRMLNHKCGWDDAKLLKWLTRKFMMADGLKLNDALLSLGEGELAEAIKMFQSHLEAKARAEAA